DTLPGRVKHSICNRRSYRRNTRLSDTRWGSRRFDDVNLYGWHFVDPQHVVSVEIAFDNPSLIKRNPRFENRAQSKANASLHLCAHLIGIYRYAAINGTHNTMHPGKARLADGYLRHLRDVRTERLRNSNTTKSTCWCGRTPSGLFRSEPQNRRMAWLVLQ